MKISKNLKTHIFANSLFSFWVANLWKKTTEVAYCPAGQFLVSSIGSLPTLVVRFSHLENSDCHNGAFFRHHAVPPVAQRKGFAYADPVTPTSSKFSHLLRGRRGSRQARECSRGRQRLQGAPVECPEAK